MECHRHCERCGANWHREPDGRFQHWWANGNKGTAPGNQSELDLAGLVCNVVNDDRCQNPCKGQQGGQTWVSRQVRSQLFGMAMKDQLQQPPQQGVAA